MLSFLFREIQLISFTNFVFNLRFLYELKHTRFTSAKLCVGFSIYDSVSFILKFIFLFNKMHGLWLQNIPLQIPFKTKIMEKP